MPIQISVLWRAEILFLFTFFYHAYFIVLMILKEAKKKQKRDICVGPQFHNLCILLKALKSIYTANNIHLHTKCSFYSFKACWVCSHCWQKIFESAFSEPFLCIMPPNTSCFLGGKQAIGLGRVCYRKFFMCRNTKLIITFSKRTAMGTIFLCIEQVA